MRGTEEVMRLWRKIGVGEGKTRICAVFVWIDLLIECGKAK